MKKLEEDLILRLQTGNYRYRGELGSSLVKHVQGQSPRYAILTCSDSRVIPEFIFNASMGEIFVVRIAGNIALDPTVIASLEHAVEHLNIDILFILGHTGCGAVKAAEESNDPNNVFLNEIQESFHIDPENHVKANLLHQLEMLPQRSDKIRKALEKKELSLIGGIYRLEDGTVDFL